METENFYTAEVTHDVDDIALFLDFDDDDDDDDDD